jgi:hypothetical protein
MIHTQFQLNTLVEDLQVELDQRLFPFGFPIFVGVDRTPANVEISHPKRQPQITTPPVEDHWISAILDKIELTLPIMREHKLDKMRQHVEFNFGGIPYACNLDVWFPVEEQAAKRPKAKTA